ncbi:hypothetical protein ACFY41_30975 [Streptomyces syringium]|uniref:hypothetical protein n=1 Tax=Streptomyces syringium TaxID=76729 RepID=UPI0036870E36
MRRISALAVTAALAGGVLFTALPVTTATAAPHKTCNINQMGQQVADLRAKAATLRKLGEPEAAKRAQAQADAIAKKRAACIKADETSAKPRW